jgi:hypothetical protein
MSDPKDWEEIVDDARKLDMLRLQREQTDHLKNIANGTSSSDWASEQMKRNNAHWSKKVGVSSETDPVEFTRRMKARAKKKTIQAAILIPILLILMWIIYPR